MPAAGPYDRDLKFEDTLRPGAFDDFIGQRKTVHSLLDPIGETLAELRRHRVPLRQIVAELKTHGLPVSESRFRAYLRNRGIVSGEPQGRGKNIKSRSKPPAPTRTETAGHNAVGNSLTLPMKS